MRRSPDFPVVSPVIWGSDMKKTVILACPTLLDEVKKCVRDTNCPYDICFLEENNHNFPNKLRMNLQTAIDGLQDYDRILLTFGLCGNATLGLVSPHAELVIPKVDDCISLLMGGAAERISSLDGKFGIFLTAGWFRYEEGIWGEMQHALRRYGENRAGKILARMYENLTYLTVLDTGAYDLQELLPKAAHLAAALHLKLRVLPGNLRLLHALLEQDDAAEHFAHIPAGTPVSAAMVPVDFHSLQ